MVAWCRFVRLEPAACNIEIAAPEAALEGSSPRLAAFCPLSLLSRSHFCISICTA